MIKLLERPSIGAYAPPSLDGLGSLRELTRGAGPDGEPIVTITPPFAPDAVGSPYEPPALEPLGSLRSLTRGAGPDGEPIMMTTGSGIPGDFPYAEGENAAAGPV